MYRVARLSLARSMWGNVMGRTRTFLVGDALVRFQQTETAAVAGSHITIVARTCNRDRPGGIGTAVYP